MFATWGNIIENCNDNDNDNDNQDDSADDAVDNNVDGHVVDDEDDNDRDNDNYNDNDNTDYNEGKSHKPFQTLPAVQRLSVSTLWCLWWIMMMRRKRKQRVCMRAFLEKASKLSQSSALRCDSDVEETWSCTFEIKGWTKIFPTTALRFISLNSTSVGCL